MCFYVRFQFWYSINYDRTDQGSHFESKLFGELNKLLVTVIGSEHHPQSNGMVERFYRQMKASLMAKCQSSNWAEELYFVLLDIRTTAKEDSGCRPVELVYGQPLRIPG